MDHVVLRYCEKHKQMTNHRRKELSLVVLFTCLKCEKERIGEKE